MRMLDICCGRFGWGKAFAERGWDVVGIDLVEPSEIPHGCTFLRVDILNLGWLPGEGLVYSGPFGIVSLGFFDFICASTPCEEFSVHGMKHFHPNPKYPEMGLKLFNHTWALCEASGAPYVMENVAPAEKFVGSASNRCGPFLLWGNGAPPLMPRGIKKGIKHAEGFRSDMTREEKRLCRLKDTMLRSGSKSKVRKQHTADAATIPSLLAACVADYAERICEVARA